MEDGKKCEMHGAEKREKDVLEMRRKGNKWREWARGAHALESALLKVAVPRWIPLFHRCKRVFAALLLVHLLYFCWSTQRCRSNQGGNDTVRRGSRPVQEQHTLAAQLVCIT
jgi:hypothetical protein